MGMIGRDRNSSLREATTNLAGMTSDQNSRDDHDVGGSEALPIRHGLNHVYDRICVVGRSLKRRNFLLLYGVAASAIVLTYFAKGHIELFVGHGPPLLIYLPA